MFLDHDMSPEDARRAVDAMRAMGYRNHVFVFCSRDEAESHGLSLDRISAIGEKPVRLETLKGIVQGAVQDYHFTEELHFLSFLCSMMICFYPCSSSIANSRSSPCGHGYTSPCSKQHRVHHGTQDAFTEFDSSGHQWRAYHRARQSDSPRAHR